MDLVWQLVRPRWHWVLLSSLAGVAAGMATVALLANINTALNQPGSMAGGLLAAFVGLCFFALLSRGVSDMTANRVGERVVAELRKSLVRNIMAAPIDELERFRTHRLLPVLTHDVGMVAGIVLTLASLAIALAIAVGCLVYLAWLSLPMFGLLAVALLLGTGLQLAAQKRGVANYWKAREQHDVLHKALRNVSDGAKELRLHRGRRARVYGQQVVGSIDLIRELDIRAVNVFVFTGALGSGLYFLLIALILGLAARRAPDPAVLSGFVLVLLYLKGPIDQILNVLPNLGQFRVSFQRVADLSARFANPEPHLALEAQGGPVAELREHIELRGAFYAYEADAGAPEVRRFEVGPIDLCIRKGEAVFIVGDNGSGKTTLIKLLLGLYVPQRGELLLDGVAVGPAQRDAYRQLFGTVFSDFHLFEDLAVDPAGKAMLPDQLAAAAAPYLERLEIAHKVAVKDGVFNTTDLSTGQRKRLALVHAYLEARPVLVFDEWAADQDPAFRRLFYTVLLPELRAAGHTLIVISHDDRYFDIADRVLHMAEGRVVSAPA